MQASPDERVLLPSLPRSSRMRLTMPLGEWLPMLPRWQDTTGRLGRPEQHRSDGFRLAPRVTAVTPRPTNRPGMQVARARPRHARRRRVDVWPMPSPLRRGHGPKGVIFRLRYPLGGGGFGEFFGGFRTLGDDIARSRQPVLAPCAVEPVENADANKHPATHDFRRIRIRCGRERLE